MFWRNGNFFPRFYNTIFCRHIQSFFLFGFCTFFLHLQGYFFNWSLCRLHQNEKSDNKFFLLFRTNLAGPINFAKLAWTGRSQYLFKIFVCLLHLTWPNVSKKIFSIDCFEQLIYDSLTKPSGPACKTINNMKFLLKNIFWFFGRGLVGATLEKSEYRLPTFVGQKFGVVPWISM